MTAEFPAQLHDVNGLHYTLKRPPKTNGDQTYPAVYAGANGEEFTPCLAFVLAVARGDSPLPTPIMLRFNHA